MFAFGDKIGGVRVVVVRPRMPSQQEEHPKSHDMTVVA